MTIIDYYGKSLSDFYLNICDSQIIGISTFFQDNVHYIFVIHKNGVVNVYNFGKESNIGLFANFNIFSDCEDELSTFKKTESELTIILGSKKGVLIFFDISMIKFYQYGRGVISKLVPDNEVSILALEISNNDKVITLDARGDLKLCMFNYDTFEWNVQKNILFKIMPDEYKITAFAFSIDSETCAIAGTFNTFNTVYIVSLENSHSIVLPAFHDSEIYFIYFLTNNGSIILSAGLDGKIVIWDIYSFSYLKGTFICFLSI